MRQVHISTAGYAWEAKDGDSLFADGATKDECVRAATERAAAEATVSDPISLVIHLEDGSIEEERTYPRSADPRESSG